MFNEYMIKYKKKYYYLQNSLETIIFELKSHTHASRQFATPNYWSPNSCPLQLAPERLKIFLNLN